MKNNYTLLYVEDDKIVRENFTEIFRNYFKNVITTNNGNEALKIFNKEHIDVAILDVNIYGIDGISVATQMRLYKDEKELILLMMSAYSDREKLLRVINLQLLKYLIKPIPNKELFNVLEEILEVLKKKHLICITDEYQWDNESRVLLYREKAINLTKNELAIIDILIKNKNRYMSACDIQSQLFENKTQENNCNNILQLLSRLKKKIEQLNSNSDFFIENCYGIGYRITIN